MAVLTIPNTFVNGATIVAAEHNANFTAVKNFCEALSDGTNIDAGVITTAKIADNAVTSGKLATGAVGTNQIASSVTLTTPNIGAASATSIAVTGNVVYHPATNAQASGYTLVLADDGKIVEMSSGGTLTVPLAANVDFPVGTQIMVIQTGASQVTIAGSAGVTVNSTPGLKLRTQWSTATLLKRATNTWLATGDLIP